MCYTQQITQGFRMIKLKGVIQGVYDFYFEEYAIVSQPRVFRVHDFVKRDDETQDDDCSIAGCKYGFFKALTIVVVCHNRLLARLVNGCGCVSLAKKVRCPPMTP